jgi:hypothetical protein
MQRAFSAFAPRRITPASRKTRLPRPISMPPINGSSGMPTMPEAQVKIFSGTGTKPASTSIQNAFHGCVFTSAPSSATSASSFGSQPMSASSGRNKPNA